MAMTIIVEPTRAVTGGVDTHLDVHVAAVLDEIGGLLATESFVADRGGEHELVGWLGSFGPLARVGVEGTGSYGAGLARLLAASGVDVVEVDRPNATAPQLLELHGVGIHTAALLLVTAGDNPQRLRSEASWAHLCGVSPIQASSGKVTRHRLNRGGDRQANHARWRIALTRMSSDERTRVYVERRTADGKSKAEIMRVLKRYIAREIFAVLPRN